MKDWLIRWMAAVVIASVWLIVGALEDKPVQDQIATDEEMTAQMQAKVEHEATLRELRANQIYMDHLLGLSK